MSVSSYAYAMLGWRLTHVETQWPSATQRVPLQSNGMSAHDCKPVTNGSHTLQLGNMFMPHECGSTCTDFFVGT